jgi:hypothetical protein
VDAHSWSVHVAERRSPPGGNRGLTAGRRLARAGLARQAGKIRASAGQSQQER